MSPVPLRAARPGARRDYVRRTLLCAVLLAPGLLADAARAQTFSTPVNVSNDGLGNAAEVLVDSHGNVDIAYAGRTGSSTAGVVRFVRSSDGGNTFSTPVEIAPNEIGRASCRERVESSVGAGS